MIINTNKIDPSLSMKVILSLVAIVESEGETMTPGALAEALDITTAAMTGLLDLLEKKDFARRIPKPGDRRALLVRVTPKGHHLLDRIEVKAVA